MGVLGVGNAFADRFAKVSDSFLNENGLMKNTTTISFTKEAVEKTWSLAGKQNDVESISLGGSGVNVIKVLSELGNNTALIGKIGPDAIGSHLEARLQNIGVKTFLSKSTKDNGIVNCFITPDHIRTMHTYLGGAVDLCKEDLLKEKNAFFEYSHVHLEGYLTYYSDVLQSSIELAKEAKTRISLDLSSEAITGDPVLKEKLIPCLKQVDIVFGNLQEYLKLTNTENVESALRSNIFNERQIIVITNGENSCWIKEPALEPVKVDLVKVHGVVDTTGAGDYFIAGFLDCLIRKNEKLAKCVLNGHLVASYIIKEMGTNLSPAAWKNLKGTL